MEKRREKRDQPSVNLARFCSFLDTFWCKEMLSHAMCFLLSVSGSSLTECFVPCVCLHSSVQAFIHHDPHRSTRGRRRRKLTIWKMCFSRDTPAHHTLITCVPPSHVTFSHTLPNVIQNHRCILFLSLIHTHQTTPLTQVVYLL